MNNSFSELYDTPMDGTSEKSALIMIFIPKHELD